MQTKNINSLFKDSVYEENDQVKEKLAGMGYTNIIEFGGILDWTGELEY